DLELVNVVFKNAGRDWYYSRQVFSTCTRSRFDVGEVRRGSSPPTKAKKKNIDAPQRFEFFNIGFQLAFKIVCVSLHRRKTLDLLEKAATKQPFEIANETQTVIHSHRRQSVLSENVNTTEQVIDFIRLRFCTQQPV